jgi:hypothetical protein
MEMNNKGGIRIKFSGQIKKGVIYYVQIFGDKQPCEKCEFVAKAIDGDIAYGELYVDGNLEFTAFSVKSGVIQGRNLSSLPRYYITHYLWIPKDKELVWGWDNQDKFWRSIGFYDPKTDSTYSPVDGKGQFYRYDNYSPYEGEWPQWAKEAAKLLDE